MFSVVCATCSGVRRFHKADLKPYTVTSLHCADGHAKRGEYSVLSFSRDVDPCRLDRVTMVSVTTVFQQNLPKVYVYRSSASISDRPIFFGSFSNLISEQVFQLGRQGFHSLRIVFVRNECGQFANAHYFFRRHGNTADLRWYRAALGGGKHHFRPSWKGCLYSL